MMTISVTNSSTHGRELTFTVGGMTCASCAARIEKKLNRIDGVTAGVNFASERAEVQYPGTISRAGLVAVVEATGYTASLPALDDPADEATAPDEPDEAASWRQRLVISAGLSLPVSSPMPA
jgi:P-type Cu+ transporter